MNRYKRVRNRARIDRAHGNPSLHAINPNKLPIFRDVFANNNPLSIQFLQIRFFSLLSKHDSI